MPVTGRSIMSGTRNTIEGFAHCERCAGKGFVECSHPEADDLMECGDCDGRGLVDTREHFSPALAAWLAGAKA